MKYTYSLVRMVATMALACCFIMLDETSCDIFFGQMTSGLSSMKYTYSLVRMVATMVLACCFIMLDAHLDCLL